MTDRDHGYFFCVRDRKTENDSAIGFEFRVAELPKWGVKAFAAVGCIEIRAKWLTRFSRQPNGALLRSNIIVVNYLILRYATIFN